MVKKRENITHQKRDPIVTHNKTCNTCGGSMRKLSPSDKAILMCTNCGATQEHDA